MKILLKNKVYNMVGETVKKQINEIVSPVVWHFCWFDNLLGILKTNSFKLSKSNVDREQFPGVTGYSVKRPYYFCTTRSKISSDGYSDLVTNDNQEGFARIQFNGNALNNIVHSKASDYFGERDKPTHGKRGFYNAIENGKKDYLKVLNKENEREDTIWYYKNSIDNINKYIERIDVCIPNQKSFFENQKQLIEIENLSNNLHIPIYFYNNIQDFDKQNNKVINIMTIENKNRLNEDDNTIKIKPTSEWMRKWYDIMNEQLFNNELGECILEPFTTGKGSNGRTLGWFKITGNNIKIKRSNRKIFQQGYYGQETYVTKENFFSICKPKIELNANYKAPEESWINTLVHEMCHYYTYMYGFAPKQGHGPEFRDIANVVSSKSNGTITIQRLASAEEMTNYDLDAEIKAKNQARLDRKKSNLYALLIVIKNGEVRLVTTTSERLIGNIGDIHIEKDDAKYYGYSDDPRLISMLFEKGYRSSMRVYRYWNITGTKLIDSLLDYKWTRYFGTCNTLSEALGLNDKIETSSPSLAVANNKQNDEIKLGYKIIQDNGGYNLLDTSINRKTFGTPVEKIWFNEKENLYCFKNGKFTFIGTPGHWSKYNNMEENTKRSMNEESDYLRKLIRETLEEIVNKNFNNDVIDITADMNLGLESPLEIM